MNWTNWRRLRDDLSELLESDRCEGFNHALPFRDHVFDLGCVACRVMAIQHGEQWDETATAEDILLFLNITTIEASELYSPSGGDESHERWWGPEGVINAIERLDVLAARYGGEPPQPAAEPVTAYVPDVAAFLAACRASAIAPVTADTE